MRTDAVESGQAQTFNTRWSGHGQDQRSELVTVPVSTYAHIILNTKF